MKVAIIGASGFIGKNLLSHLLRCTDYKVNAIAPDPPNVTFDPIHLDRVEVFKADVLEYDSMRRALGGCDAAFFLVHLMADKGDFFDKEAKAAETTGKALADAKISRVIYLSGLGSDKEKLSQHLASRHNTGEILRRCIPCLIEFRASMVIAKGSISFDIVRALDTKLPIVFLPRWASTKTQPIALLDVLEYLEQAIKLPDKKHEIVEIGGPEAMSYVTFLRRYASFLGRHSLILRLPFVTEWLAGWGLYLVLPRKLARVGQHMVSSFRNEMIVTNQRAKELFPDIIPRPIEEAFDCCNLADI